MDDYNKNAVDEAIREAEMDAEHLSERTRQDAEMSMYSDEEDDY